MLIDASANHSIASHTRSFLASLPSARLVAAYSPLPTEPGAGYLLDALSDLDVDVLLPVSLPGGELQWAAFDPAAMTSDGPFSIAEPSGERFPSSVLARCDAVILPALGVDRRGMRLGQGAGYYDRALAAAEPECPLVALVYGREVHDVVPSEDHDKPVDGAITEAGFIPLGPENFG